MKVKVSEASGPVLDWMVAKCEGRLINFLIEHGKTWVFMCLSHRDGRVVAAFSTEWAQGGPIIEQEHLCLEYKWFPEGWECRNNKNAFARGPTPLIAAMRCFVVSKLDEEVEVPDELVKEN